MNSSSQECRMKALELLASEFSNKKYGQFVKKEIEALESGLKEEIGFQSESDDVVLDITLNGCFRWRPWRAKRGPLVPDRQRRLPFRSGEC